LSDSIRGSAANHPISFALIGAGSVGAGVFHQSLLTENVRCDVVCDSNLELALACNDSTRAAKLVASVGELADVVRTGRLAICEDATLAAAAPSIDVLFDASTAIDAAPQFITMAMAAGKHVVMMNAEADELFGPFFWREAQRHEVAYTSADGDQPAVLARLVEELRFYGLTLVMAGNIKGFLDRYTDPIKIQPEAAKRYLNPQMCASYTDGTKLAVEMSIVANGLGCNLLRNGMIGPRAVEAIDLLESFDLASHWRLGDPPLVDYILGAKPKGGVFVVGYTEDVYQRRMLDWFPPEIGPGPFYVLTRPYHLVHMETMRTVIEVARTGRSLLAPRFGRRTEVVSYAKQDLPMGTTLTGPGGPECYGLIEMCDRNSPGLPICLSSGARLKRDILKDSRIEFSAVEERSLPAQALSAYKGETIAV
jgi:predicted homoserine dehydrogenase-like protein